MKKRYFFTLLLTQFVFSQTPAIQWQRTMGGTDMDEAHCIRQTTDGGYVLAGFTLSTDGDIANNHGNYDILVAKYSSSGTLIWTKTIGGTDYDDATAIEQTSDGGYIISGITYSNDGDVTGYHSQGDAWVIKFSSDGAIVWQKVLGGNSAELAGSIQQTSDGGYIVAGYAYDDGGDVSGTHGGYDVWVVKLSGSGILEWQKALGGTDEDAASSIRQTTDGGYIVAGYTYSNDGDVTNYHGYGDVWVAKLSSSGNLEWQKTLGGTDVEYAKSIRQTSDGGYVVVCDAASHNGDMTGNHGMYDVWVVKLSDAGILQWQKNMGGTQPDYGGSILQTADGGYIVAGSTFSANGDVTINHGGFDGWLLKLSDTGILQWQETFGGVDNDTIYTIDQTTDGGYVAAGITYSSNGNIIGNHGAGDFWMVKFGPEVLAMQNFSNQDLKYYPNPVSSVLTLQSPYNLTFDKIIVSDMAGKTVVRQYQNNNQINVEELTSGIYMLEAFSGEDKFIAKFVKK